MDAQPQLSYNNSAVQCDWGMSDSPRAMLRVPTD